MNDIAIEVNHVWKKFRKGEIHDSLRDLIPALTKGLMSRNNKRSELGKNDFWALKDINFRVRRGEILGIIGPNGAGKSTMLKLLSRILKPNVGNVRVNGRQTALIEVGAGFHQDLTGKENIYLNGAILGMKREETDKIFDQIVDFSGLEEFIDTPVKRYSSGMYARLGFSVAAHVDPEILMVDEVLAVGDATFQKKCLRKMGDVATEGRTVLFVSHNLASIQNLCGRVIWLEKGGLRYDGDSQIGIEDYVRSFTGGQVLHESHVIDLTTAPGRPHGLNPILQRIELFDGEHNPLRGGVLMGGTLQVHIYFRGGFDSRQFLLGIGFDNIWGQRVFTAHSDFDPKMDRRNSNHGATEPGLNRIICEIPNFILVPGQYNIKISLARGAAEVDRIDNAMRLDVVESGYYGMGKLPWNGVCVMRQHWYYM